MTPEEKVDVTAERIVALSVDVDVPGLPGRRAQVVDFQATSLTDRKRCAVCRMLVNAMWADLDRHARLKHGGTVGTVEPGLRGSK